LSLKGLEENYFTPFLYASIFRLMTWFYGGSNLKSLGELNRLVNEVILADDFQQKDFVGFSASRKSERLDKHEQGPSSRLPEKNGWIKALVKIVLPAVGVKLHSEADAPQFSVRRRKVSCICTQDVLEAISLITSRTHLLRVVMCTARPKAASWPRPSPKKPSLVKLSWRPAAQAQSLENRKPWLPDSGVLDLNVDFCD
jgi:hypothetical protein